MLIFIVIVILIVSIYSSYKTKQILDLPLQEIIEIHNNAFKSYRNWFIFSLILFFTGYIMSKTCTMYEIEEYEYWFFGTEKGTREVLTTSGWWSYILRVLGVIIGIPCLFGLVDRYNALSRYKNMSNFEYMSFQNKIQDQINKQEKIAKNTRRAVNVIKTINRIMNL